VEYQGTFPLPEAQMDRFALSLSLGYPAADEELQMIQRIQGGRSKPELKPCITLSEINHLQQACQQVQVEASLQQYILDLVRSTREDEEISLGVSPRGTVALVKAVQALAYLSDRDYALPDDVKYLAPYVLAHRMIPNTGRRSRPIVERLLRTIAIP
jgi:MoxR-like ATPase